MVETIRGIIFKCLILIIFITLILAIVSEMMPNGWLAYLVLTNIVSFFLVVYVYDPRIYYRRAVPLLVCSAAIIYTIFKPLLQHNKMFKKCYKIKQMSGSLADCYYDVQDVYDEYSNYNKE